MKNEKLTYEEACRLFRYDPETGRLYWKVARSNVVKVGDEAGVLFLNSGRLYRRVSVNKKKYMTHRVIWLLLHQSWPKYSIDHINGDGLDNKKENLRDASKSVNGRNAIRKNNGVTGYANIQKHLVRNSRGWEKQYFMVVCRNSEGRTVSKSFDTIDEALKNRKTILFANGHTSRHGVAEA